MLPASNLLLLSCRSPFLDDAKVYPPLANFYLKSYVERYLPDTRVIVGDDDYDVEHLAWVRDYDAVGISIMTPQRHEALRLAAAIKAASPRTTVIAGGPHVKHYWQDLAREPVFDFLVPLDGEKALVAILAGQASSRTLSSVLTREEIATQPRPDRTSDNAIQILRRYRYLLCGRPATTLMTARGCPERCTFCEEALTAVRWSSLDSIGHQLDDIRAAGWRAVYIFDDLFAISLPKIQPICQQLSKRELWYRCNAQARYFTKWGEDMAQLLANTGCVEVAFGAESGSQRILDNVQKRCTVEQNYQTVRYAKKYGIQVKAFILLGLPGENAGTLAETEAFIRDSGIDDFQCAVYMPFRGTAIRQALDHGTAIDLQLRPAGSDGEITGAYGIKGGQTAYEVRTCALSAEDLRQHRDHLVSRYRPRSHRSSWQNEDCFFDEAISPYADV
ncbi:MAG: radical SAM protein [Luteitalea sp.]|nr:radical SAM protein [Luteitalea sp.]